MTALPKKKKYTAEEYLVLEDAAEYRSEYWNGQIVKLAGGTLDHNTITLNTATELRTKLRGKCRVFAVDIKVWIDVWNSFVYPDVFAVCDESKYHGNRRDIITNPYLIIEVLSDGTQAFDKGDKFLAYQTVESLQEYVLIDQSKYLVEQYIKQSDGGWKYFATIGQESEVNLYSVNQTLKLQEIYDLIEFESE